MQASEAYATRIPFVSTCPNCGHERAQWYTQIALMVLMRRGQAVQGYCGPCQTFWELRVDERDQLAAKLAS